MTTGLDDFKSVLAEFRSISVWAGVSSVSIPFVAAFAGVIPPWPPHIEYITAVFQLLAIIFMYQLFSDSPRTIASKNIKRLSLFVFVIFFVYLFLFSLFTIHITEEGVYLIIGYQCTEKAVQVYRDACPFLGLQELQNALYDEFALWTKLSVSIVRMVITLLWCLFFIGLSALIGQFLIFQRARNVKTQFRS
jgi:hypothetical protein